MASAEPIEGTLRKAVHKLKNERGSRRVNVGEAQRLISIAVGIPVTIFGLTRGILNGLVPKLLGSSLILRGVTGHSFLYQTPTALPRLRKGDHSSSSSVHNAAICGRVLALLSC